MGGGRGRVVPLESAGRRWGGAGCWPDISLGLSPGIKMLTFQGGYCAAQVELAWVLHRGGVGMVHALLLHAHTRIRARIPGTNARVKGALVISIHGYAVVSIK